MDGTVIRAGFVPRSQPFRELLTLASPSKISAAETVMAPGAMKPLLRLSKQEPVQAAFGVSTEGEAVVLLDKHLPPKSVLGALRTTAGKAKIALNAASLRFGRAEVDVEYDPTMVRFWVNQDPPAGIRPRLVEVMRQAGYMKVEINVDPALGSDQEDGAPAPAAGSEGEPQSPLPPEAPPPPTAQPDAGRLAAALTAMVHQLQGLQAPPPVLALLRTHAATVGGLIKEARLAEAGQGLLHLRAELEKVAQASGGAAPTPPPEAEVPPHVPLLPLWLGAREQADAGIVQLQEAFRETGRTGLRLVAEYGIQGLTEGQGVAMMVALREYDAQPNAPRARQRLEKALAGFRLFLDEQAALLEALERNPLGVGVALRRPLAAALDAIALRLAA